MCAVARFLNDESGATSVEYAMIAVAIAVAIIATVHGLGTNLKGAYVSVENAMN
jgi:pilus assembly protein Flp/PilA